ncbi:hypothetical protein JCM11491_002019 [Sporobolomyces phaffii]
MPTTSTPSGSASVPSSEPTRPADVPLPRSSTSCTFEPSTNPRDPPRRPARFSLSGIRRSFSLQRPSLSRPAPEPAPPHVGHQARVCYVVMTASMFPREDEGQSRKGLRKALVDKPNATSAKVNPLTKGLSASLPQDTKEIKPVVKTKAVRKLKSDLLKPDKARAIVADLKRIDVPDDSSPESHASTVTATRAFSLSNDIDKPVSIVSLSALSLPTSEGGIAGIATAKSGAFEILADVSGALIRKTGKRADFVAPSDSVGLFLYWWGFELSLPPAVLVKLSSVHSVQQTFLGFLQAFAVTGGAPEIAPFVRYISNYLDMEFAAIQSQNKAGKGVVLAATWLLPVALVPRPWDFPLEPRKKAHVDSATDPRTSLSNYSTFVPLGPRPL